ncbi:amidohydrolase family protein [uncultured Martelella sp.]|uniref:amidohydrolase family protein n=1 Tax=uncultured Martelella sp. TaxID=392331 RepID=UPI0029C680DC|nr:amidohydrolase family protein [uncultured Martelella sp.]
MLDIIDSHIHLWSPETIVPPWVREVPELNQSFGLNEWRQAAGTSEDFQLAGAVYVEIDAAPQDREAENRLAFSVANDPSNPVMGAVVAASLSDGDIADQLRPWLGERGLKGVRQVLHIPPCPRGLCVEPVFIANLKTLGSLGLAFDACMRPGELDDLARAAEAAPETVIVLDHAGNPGDGFLKEGAGSLALADWLQGIERLAACDNVFCKISGMTLPEHTSPEISQGAIDALVDRFGDDRVMFASNFPVNQLGTASRAWIDFLISATHRRGTTWQTRFFGENAARAYRLDD